MPKTLAIRVNGSTTTLIAVSARRMSFTLWEMTDSLVASRASATSL